MTNTKSTPDSTPRLTDAEIEELTALAKAATPGPWVAESSLSANECAIIASNDPSGKISNPSRGMVLVAVRQVGISNTEVLANAKLASAALALLTELSTTRRERDDAREWIAKAIDDFTTERASADALAAENAAQGATITRVLFEKGAAEVENARLRDAAESLRLVLPMAKGYAHQHQVGVNARLIAGAEAAIAALEEETETDSVHESLTPVGDAP